MNSKINMVNAALLLVGAKKIGSMSDNTKSARLATTIYDQCESEVESLPINFKFMQARAELSRLTDAPIFGPYDYQYALPDSCVRITAHCDETGRKKEFAFEREVYISGDEQTDVILTNEETVYVKYMAKRTNPALYPGWYAKLIITKIALYLAEPMKQRTEIYNKLKFIWEEALSHAEDANAMESADVNWNNERLDEGNNDLINAANGGDDVTVREIEVLQ